MEIELIKDRFVYLVLNKSVVIPHIFFIEHLGISERLIRKWLQNLGQEEQRNYVRIIKGNILENFLLDYPHDASAVLSDELIMITQGGVKALLKFASLKKRCLNKDELPNLIELFTAAFSAMRVENGNAKKMYTCDERECEDQRYKIEDVGMNIKVSNSPGAIVNATNGDNNDVAFNHNKDEMFKANKWAKIKLIVAVIVFMLLLIVIFYIVYVDYQETQNLALTIKNMSWLEWILALLDLGSGVLSLIYLT